MKVKRMIHDHMPEIGEAQQIVLKHIPRLRVKSVPLFEAVCWGVA